MASSCDGLITVVIWTIACSIQMISSQTQECKTTSLGKEYNGHRNTTINGLSCQPWTSDSPHTNYFKNDTLYPDGSVAAALNYCRNPDSSSGGPWCYTTNSSVRFEYCGIPLCSEIGCKTTALGKEYTGKKSSTVNGLTCQAWTKDSPHTNYFKNDTLYPDGSVAAAVNYCRNPDSSSGGPWCYTMNSNVRFEYCGIEMCVVTTTVNPYDTTDGPIGCKTTSLGKEYTGQKRHTTSGLLCQPWVSNSPHSHGFHNDTQCPDGSVTAASNYCRNPDGTSGGPWCYTMVDSPRYETCGIPNCEVPTTINPYDTTDGPIGCKTTSLGKEYTGQKRHTTSGLLCQPWISNSPHSHGFHNDTQYPDGSVTAASNYCRNPDGTSGGPWCYTMVDSPRYETCGIPNCEVPTTINPYDTTDGPIGCKTTSLGKEYTGQKRHTSSGLLCQPWVSNSPHSHGFHNDTQYPDGSVTAASNYCRNPDGTSGGPWCYTMVDSPRYETCGIPNCEVPNTINPYDTTDGPIGCKTTSLGKEYTGQKRHTTSGLLCQPWISNSPHSHGFHNDTQYPDGSVTAASNYCRNPDGTSGGPWCYTMADSPRYETCGIPNCEVTTTINPYDTTDGPIGCKTTSLGKEYTGQKRHTSSGLLCQPWVSDSPHSHPNHQDSQYPDGTVAAASNYCRNPDSSSIGPWCYTMVDSPRYEECGVPFCQTTAEQETTMARETTVEQETTMAGETEGASPTAETHEPSGSSFTVSQSAGTTGTSEPSSSAVSTSSGSPVSFSTVSISSVASSGSSASSSAILTSSGVSSGPSGSSSSMVSSSSGASSGSSASSSMVSSSSVASSGSSASSSVILTSSGVSSGPSGSSSMVSFSSGVSSGSSASFSMGSSSSGTSISSASSSMVSSSSGSSSGPSASSSMVLSSSGSSSGPSGSSSATVTTSSVASGPSSSMVSTFSGASPGQSESSSMVSISSGASSGPSAPSSSMASSASSPGPSTSSGVSQGMSSGSSASLSMGSSSSGTSSGSSASSSMVSSSSGSSSGPSASSSMVSSSSGSSSGPSGSSGSSSATVTTSSVTSGPSSSMVSTFSVASPGPSESSSMVSISSGASSGPSAQSSSMASSAGSPGPSTSSGVSQGMSSTSGQAVNATTEAGSGPSGGVIGGIIGGVLGGILLLTTFALCCGFGRLGPRPKRLVMQSYLTKSAADSFPSPSTRMSYGDAVYWNTPATRYAPDRRYQYFLSTDY